MGIGLGPWEIILILVVLLLVFGAKRLPELGGALGKGIREFKGSIKSIETEINTPDQARPPQQTPPRQVQPPPPQAPEASAPRPAEPVQRDRQEP